MKADVAGAIFVGIHRFEDALVSGVELLQRDSSVTVPASFMLQLSNPAMEIRLILPTSQSQFSMNDDEVRPRMSTGAGRSAKGDRGARRAEDIYVVSGDYGGSLVTARQPRAGRPRETVPTPPTRRP